MGGAIATLSRGCTGSLSIMAAGVVGAGVAVTSGTNVCLVGVGTAVACVGAAVTGAGVGAAGAGVEGAGVAVAGAIVGVGCGAGACVGVAVATSVVSGVSSPQATITIAIKATTDSIASICHFLSHIDDFTFGPPSILHKIHTADKQD